MSFHCVIVTHSLTALPFLQKYFGDCGTKIKPTIVKEPFEVLPQVLSKEAEKVHSIAFDHTRDRSDIFRTLAVLEQVDKMQQVKIYILVSPEDYPILIKTCQSPVHFVIAREGLSRMLTLAQMMTLDLQLTA